MSVEILNLDKINIKTKKILENFCKKFLENSTSCVESIILYGSAVGIDFVGGKSNINILIIVKNFTFDNFKPTLSLFEQYSKKDAIIPLVFTSDEIKNSADVFPIEFFDIKENHVLLWGNDLFMDLEIKHDNLRLQCEQELKGKIIKLRQIYLESGKHKENIEYIITSTFSSFIPVFKNLIRLKNKIPPKNKEEIIKVLSVESGIDVEILLAILYDIKGDKKIGSEDAMEFFEKYLSILSKLADIIDKP